MKLYELIVAVAERGLELQNRQTGAMPAGHNGLYRDPDTPVRNTAHWLMVFLKGYDIAGKKGFHTAAGRALNYLLSDEARPMGKTFFHRFNPEKDFCNGLIGQAWTLEALVMAGEKLDRDDAIRTAGEVFLLHPFDENRGLWKRVACDGMHLPFDETFNHQLWFAAAGAGLSRHHDDVRRQVQRFMEMLPENLRIYPSGLISHPLVMKKTLKEKVKVADRHYLQLRGEAKKLKVKSAGYHAFNLYGFAMLNQQFPDDSFWNSRLFRKALGYAQRPSFMDELNGNPFAFPYNPAGIEMAFAIRTFGLDSYPSHWVNRQLSETFDTDQMLMNRNTEDPATLAARFYQAVRLDDLEIIFPGNE